MISIAAKSIHTSRIQNNVFVRRIGWIVFFASIYWAAYFALDTWYHKGMSKQERSIAIGMWVHRPLGMKSVHCTAFQPGTITRECTLVFNINGTEQTTVQTIVTTDHTAAEFEVVWDLNDPLPLKTYVNTNLNLDNVSLQDTINWMTRETNKAIRDLEKENGFMYNDWMIRVKNVRSYG